MGLGMGNDCLHLRSWAIEVHRSTYLIKVLRWKGEFVCGQGERECDADAKSQVRIAVGGLEHDQSTDRVYIEGEWIKAPTPAPVPALRTGYCGLHKAAAAPGA